MYNHSYASTTSTCGVSIQMSSHVSSSSISGVDCLVNTIGNKLTAVVLTAGALSFLALSVDAFMIGTALLRVAFAGAFVAAGLSGAAYILGSIVLLAVSAKLVQTAIKVF